MKEYTSPETIIIDIAEESFICGTSPGPGGNEGVGFEEW